MVIYQWFDRGKREALLRIELSRIWSDGKRVCGEIVSRRATASGDGERGGTVSRKKLASLVAVMHQLGDIDDQPPVEKLVLQGVHG